MGVKIVGEAFEEKMKAYIKIGGETVIKELSGKRSELELEIPLEYDDIITCVVFNDKETVAVGGRHITEREIREIRAEADKIEYEQKTSRNDGLNSEEREKSEALKTIKNNGGKEQNTTEEERTDTKNDFNSEKKESEEKTDGLTDNVKAETANREKEQKEWKADKTEEQKIGNEEDDSEEREMLRRLQIGKKNYYIEISDKVDELFVVYPKEKILSETIPDSEWVKIKYDGEDYYVVGKLKENNKVKYLGYGVPGVEKVKPPKITDGIANWFPLEGLTGYDGYWLFFQDAETGKIDK